ncbi:hypothetical protein ACKLNZ_03480 [Thermus scotoductus]
MDRLWPRGLSKEKARVNWRAKEFAPPMPSACLTAPHPRPSPHPALETLPTFSNQAGGT